MKTRDVLERIMDIYNKQKEVEEMVNDLFCYIYHKELEKQRKKEVAEIMEEVRDDNNA